MNNVFLSTAHSLLKPLKVGNKIFSGNLIQGPLAGYSCWPLRLLATRYGNPAFCYTEMLSAKDLATRKNIHPRFSLKHPQEGPVCFQLSGTDAEELKKATERVITWGADLIDLNCGCPVTKIRQKGAGSKLLETPDLLKKLIQSIKSISPVPVSIKIRVDEANPIHSYSLTAAQIAQEMGIDFITIHGRHWTESYETPCRQDQIAAITEQLSIPVIANGDAKDTPSTLDLLKNTGTDGVMIARASVGQPWIFEKIQKESRGDTFIPPTPAEIWEIFLFHLNGLIELEGEAIGVLQSRKLIKYYTRFFPLEKQNECLQHMKTLQRLKEIETIIQPYFEHIDH